MLVLQRLKHRVSEELKDHCTTFEVLVVLAWRMRNRVLEIPLDQSIKIFFVVDVRREFDPLFAEGYYDNGWYMVCARSITTEEVVNGSLSHAINMIKKVRLSVNEECT